MTVVRVLAVASEFYPLIKTGGLADVAGALPAALAREDVQVTTLVPGYPAVLAGLETREVVHSYGALFGAPARLVRGRAAGADLLVLDAGRLFDRPGNPYLGADGRDWPDNAFRFAALARAAADVGSGVVAAFHPHVVHGHDWQAGLVPAYLHIAAAPRPATITTIHNLAFQGLFPAAIFGVLGLPPSAYGVDGVEFYGQVSYLKAGIHYADRVTTVSPTYAREIRTPAFGMRLDGVLRARGGDLVGILNGLDTTVWDPATDAAIAARYDIATHARRRTNRAALQARFGLAADGDALLCAVVSRLTDQKGIDVLIEALPALIDGGGQLAVLGTGDPLLEAALTRAASDNAGRVGLFLGYDEALAHLVQAGADALVVPSRFEPCGLTQLAALRYGAVPIVARVGGLADSVIDANEMAVAAGVATGVQFAPVTGDELAEALRRALSLKRDEAAWRRLQENGMRSDVGWRRAAHAYAALYRSLI